MDGLEVRVSLAVEVPAGIDWPAQVQADAELIARAHGYGGALSAELVERFIARACGELGLRVYGMSSGYVVPADGAMCAEGGLS